MASIQKNVKTVLLGMAASLLAVNSAGQLVRVDADVIAPRPAYVGNAATRCFPCNNRNAAITRNMSRSFHIARERLYNPVVEYANWAFSNASEVDGYAGATIKVAIEYPAGSTPVYANECIAAGNAAVPHPIGNTKLTFGTTANPVVIPWGAIFFMRVYVVGPNGVTWTQLAGGNQSQWGSAPGEFCELGTTDNDKVMSGSGSVSGAVYAPMVIATSKTSPSPVIIGDSRPAGGAGTNLQANYDNGPETRILGPVFGYSNFAMSATLLSQWNAGSHTYFYQLLAKGYWTHLITAYGTNDIGNAQTAATILANRATCAANLKAIKPDLIIIGETIYPYVSSSDVFVTKANQNIGAYNSGNQYRTFTLNNGIRAGIVGEDYVWDIADALDPTREGLYPVSADVGLAARTPASCTAGAISGTTFTAGGTVTGTFKPNDYLYDAALNIKDSTMIVEQLTATTFRVNKNYNGSFPNPAAVAATTVTTAGTVTRDGLHVQNVGEEIIIRDKGPDLITKIAA